MSILLAVNGWDPAPWLAHLRAALPGREIVTPATLRDRAGLRYAAAWRHTPGDLADLPNLRAIFSLGAGVDHLFRDARLPDAPIVRVVDPDLVERMSEWVVLHALLHLRQLRRYETQQMQRVWADDAAQPAARDVRVGILGLGALGADAARKLAAMGFEVAGWSRRPRAVERVRSFHGADGLDAMLAQTDILICLLPLTPSTRGVLNANLFRKLARGGRTGGAILLNAGRGGLQIEADIIDALDSGVLKAASLDVFETEPLPADSPLWRHPRVLVSPHNAAISEPGVIAAYIARQIKSLERGGALENIVDPLQQY